MTAPQPVGKRLPYWTSRTLDVPNGALAVLIMKDGTICAGLRVNGVALFCSPTEELNRIARVTRDALTVLPPGPYIQTRFEHGPPRDVAVYLDEVDIHLNPKIGSDWMNRGKQKEVMTPGQNAKRYIAGALDARTGQLLWTQSDRKNSLLVIALLRHLVKT